MTRSAPLGLAALIGIPGLGLYLTARALGIAPDVAPSTLTDVWWRVPVLVASAFANAWAEEVVMIGYLLTRLRQLGWSENRALGAAAVLRGAYHLYQGVGAFVGNAVMGCVFGRVWQRHNRLWPLIGAHALIDVVAFVGYAFLPGSRGAITAWAAAPRAPRLSARRGSGSASAPSCSPDRTGSPAAPNSSSIRPASTDGSQRFPSPLTSATDVHGWKISTLSPCTPNTLPLMCDDSSEHRKLTSGATFSGAKKSNSPRSSAASRSSRNSCGIRSSVIRVSAVGAIAFDVIPPRAPSIATIVENAAMPALAAP